MKLEVQQEKFHLKKVVVEQGTLVKKLLYLLAVV
jgi:hypothetical protein